MKAENSEKTGILSGPTPHNHFLTNASPSAKQHVPTAWAAEGPDRTAAGILPQPATISVTKQYDSCCLCFSQNAIR
jgi:hypothetical protein